LGHALWGIRGRGYDRAIAHPIVPVAIVGSSLSRGRSRPHDAVARARHGIAKAAGSILRGDSSARDPGAFLGSGNAPAWRGATRAGQ
jgi:hypothetical protein